MPEDKLAELAQRLYEDDGHSGNIYKKASVKMLRFYENKAQSVTEEDKLKGGNYDTGKKSNVKE